ncbi:MAG: hypothetical protein ACR2QE_16400 [Acidimicrobiales bacterium]
MRIRGAVVGVCVALTALSGCGSSDDTSDPADDAASEPESSEDGQATIADDGDNGGGESAPADLGDFPIPAPPGGTVTFTNEVDDITAITFSLPPEDFDATVAFYDDWTDSEADEYQRVVAESDGVSWLRTSGADGTSRIIMVSAASGADDQVLVSLTDATG